MSWLYSQALEAEYSEDNCSDGKPSAPSNSTPMPQAFCAHDKMTDFSRPSRFGMTFGHLTESHGEALLTWFLAGFRARTSLQREKVPVLRVSDPDSGLNSLASLARYDRNSRSWKTPQHSLLGDSEPFSETWPRWGLMRDGVCWEQMPLGPPISGTGSGLWPTPTVHGNYNAPKSGTNRGTGLATAVRLSATTSTELNGRLNPTWVEWLMGWPLGWTDLQQSATGKFLSAHRQLGDY